MSYKEKSPKSPESSGQRSDQHSDQSFAQHSEQSSAQHSNQSSAQSLSAQTFSFQPIGVIRSCYQQKFGIPRQPSLTTADESELELLPPFNHESTVKGLAEFSHIWIQFIFHQTLAEGWRPTIRPPKLGGKKRVGVFATRSTHRPNPLGLSVVRLKEIVSTSKKLVLKLGSADLLNGTPVIDIKPYLPYVDSVPQALGSFTTHPPPLKEIQFSAQALQQCLEYQTRTGRDIQTLIAEVLSQDPRPPYLVDSTYRRHGVLLWDMNVVWENHGDYFWVMHLESPA